MTEDIKLKFDDDLYDAYLAECMSTGTTEAGDLEIVCKENALASGAPGALITFHVMIDGQERRVQAATTCKLLRTLGSAMNGFLRRVGHND